MGIFGSRNIFHAICRLETGEQEATKHFSKKDRKNVAIRASAVAFVALLFFIFIGQLVLEAMDVSLAAFQISGGVILFLFALTMIFGSGKPESEKEMIKDYKHVMVFPLAIPSIASPGAIMAVVLLTDNNIYTLPQQDFTTLLVLLVIFFTSLILLGAGEVSSDFKVSKPFRICRPLIKKTAPVWRRFFL